MKQKTIILKTMKLELTNIIDDNNKEIIENSKIEYINNMLPIRERL